MKNFKQVVAIIVLVLISGLTVAKNALAADIVGNESYDISWHGISDALQFQLFMGQADQNRKDTVIIDGLDNRSRSLTINYLKPCTTYVWNLFANKGSMWKWVWESDQSFTTGGTCPNGKNMSQPTAKIVGTSSATATWTPIDGADHYNVYYRTASDSSYTSALTVPADGSSVMINYLGSGAYYYKVAGVIGGGK